MANDSIITRIREKRLVVQSQARDRGAFRELVVLYEKKLVYYIRRMIGEKDEAYDVMQEVWILVFKRIHALKAPEAFRVWLYKIAHDVAVSHLRRKNRWPKSIPSQLELVSSIDQWDEFKALENAELVHQALEQLSPVHREVLTLRFLEEMEISEIAQVTDTEIGTVKSRLHYAKHALREQIEGAGHE